MNISQIQYFLEAARCLNISEAARHLYITQPTLGRQLTALEKELNMQLFLRSNKGLLLTPAGRILSKEFSKVIEAYQAGVEKAEAASKGFSGTLSIGILDGLKASRTLSGAIAYFETHFPNVELSIQRLSFRDLIEGIRYHTLDGAISLDFNFQEQSDLKVQNICSYIPAFAIPRHHPLAQKDRLDFTDFQNIPLVIVDQHECASGVNKIVNKFRELTGFYPKFHFTATMKDAILWVESGQKCALLNMEMQIADSKLIKMYPLADPEPNYIQLAFHKDTSNYAIHLLQEYYCHAH